MGNHAEQRMNPNESTRSSVGQSIGFLKRRTGPETAAATRKPDAGLQTLPDQSDSPDASVVKVQPPEELRGISGLRRLSGSHCVYFLVEQGRVVYVGMTSWIARRTQAHTDKPHGEVYYFEVESSRKALDLEAYWILRLHPKHNKQYQSLWDSELRKWKSGLPSILKDIGEGGPW